jgi:auxin responsive GH3 gene family
VWSTLTAGALGSLGLVAYDVSNKIWSDSHTPYTAFYQHALHGLMRTLGAHSRKKFDESSAHFGDAQKELLLGLLDRHKGTALGQDLGYGSMASVDDFRRRVPLTDYGFYRSKYIQRIKNGEANVMTSKKVDLLGATSGTSGHKALIPHTTDVGRAFFLHGITLVFDGLFSKAFKHADQLQKTCKLTFIPRWTYTEGSERLKIGPASSSPDDRGFSRLLPLYSSPKAAFHVKNEKAALYAHLLFALSDRNLGIVEANFAPMILSFFSMLEESHEALVRDLCDGTSDGARGLGMEDQEAAQVAEHLRPNPERAREVQEAIERWKSSRKDNRPTIGLAKLVWPNLNLILTVTTGAFLPYAKRLNTDYLGGAVPCFSPIYAATEGLVGINLSPAKRPPAYSLIPKALFYEFIPVEGAETEENSSPPLGGTLLANNLAVGEKYELVITNLAGLVRYRMGDVVKLERYEGTAPVVSFQYRQGQVLNVRGEKMNEQCLTRAVEAWAKKENVSLIDFCAAEDVTVVEPGRPSRPRYHLFIEPATALVGTSSSKESRSVDEELRRYSDVYDSYRRKDAIDMVKVHILQKGSFENFRTQFLKESTTGTVTQFKIPRVLRRKRLVELLLPEEYCL